MDIHKAIVNVKAFLPSDKEICKIIEICDLKPDPNNWKHWVDFGSNKLILKNNKTIFSYKKHGLKKKLDAVTDIHFKSSIDVIANNSKWAMISFAKNNKELVHNICYIWFMCNDNKLKLLVFMKNEWIENQFPLSSGTKTLRTIVRNLDIDTYKTIIGPKKVRGPYQSRVCKTWITKWPPSQAVKLDMLLTDRLLAHKILQDCGVI